MLKRILYLGYYLKQLDWNTFQSFQRHTRQQTDKSFVSLWGDILVSTFRYNISILDYFYFRFFEKQARERKAWAGTGFMYEYQLGMNPKASRSILEDKIQFSKAYQDFIRRKVATRTELDSDPGLLDRFLEADKLVLKGSTGQVGAEVKVIATKDYTAKQLLDFMKVNAFDMAEEYVIQHQALRHLSDSGLNTLRIFSQLNEQGTVEWLGARLRITVNSPVDNMAAGNLAAPVDMETGKVNGPAVYSDITKPFAAVHPISGYPIEGFQIPYWQETLSIVREAALLHPENRSIGWDIAISDKGPELIEGNHNWCKLLWQLPAQQGLKHLLQRYQ